MTEEENQATTATETAETTTEQTIQQDNADTTTEHKEEVTTDGATKEPADDVKTDDGATATDTTDEPKDWEKIAKDNQASFTKVSQEKAELAKKLDELERKYQPKMVQDGKINPVYADRYKMEVDNREFLTYGELARQLEPEDRQEVEELLRSAQSLYSSNKRAYQERMNEIKDHFRSDIVEDIATAKQQLMSEMNGAFSQAMQQDKQARADRVAQDIENIPEINALVNPDSKDYSPEVFGIVKSMFDYTGTIDTQLTKDAITKIKELGVKEYLAKQSAQTASAQAKVPTGRTVAETHTTEMPTREELTANPHLYKEAVKKFGMDKVDSVIMKG